jgi:hypothetical protein
MVTAIVLLAKFVGIVTLFFSMRATKCPVLISISHHSVPAPKLLPFEIVADAPRMDEIEYVAVLTVGVPVKVCTVNVTGAE